MPCTKQVFDSPEQAHKKLRVWQKKGRRAELDNAHVYKADCTHPQHRGKFHIGRKHDTLSGLGPGRPSAGTSPHARIFGELDDIFDRQFSRITSRFTSDDERRRQRFVRNDDGPLIKAESGTLAPLGDDIHVEYIK